MRPFVSDSLVLNYSSVRGTILDQQKYSETHVVSSSGGGNVVQGSGYVAAPNVTSYAVTKHDFLFTDDSGTRHAIKLRQLDVPMVTGDEITVFYAENESGDSLPALLANHSANRYWHLAPVNDQLTLAGYHGTKYVNAEAVAFIVSFFVLWAVLNFLWAVGVSAVVITLLSRTYKKHRTSLLAHLDQLGSSALTTEKSG